MKLEEMFERFVEENKLQMERVRYLEDGPEHMVIGINGEHGAYGGFGVCFEEESLFLFYTSLGLTSVPEKECRLMKRMMELNSKLKVGAFYIDDSNGGLAFRLTQYFVGDGEEENRSLMAALITYAGRVTDRYYSELQEILSEERS